MEKNNKSLYIICVVFLIGFIFSVAGWYYYPRLLSEEEKLQNTVECLGWLEQDELNKDKAYTYIKRAWGDEDDRERVKRSLDSIIATIEN